MAVDQELERVLGELRHLSTSEAEKGERFERLMLGFLRVAPQWATKFSHVWLWEDWPGNGGDVDTGIDLVAEHADGSGFTAVQCKFYAESTSLTLEETGTFFARSGNDLRSAGRVRGQHRDPRFRRVARRWGSLGR